MLRPLYPGKETRYPLYRKLGGPQGRSGRVRKIWPSPRFLFYFLVLCISSEFCSLSWLSCILPFCLYLQPTTQISMPPAGFESATPSAARPLGSAGRPALSKSPSMAPRKAHNQESIRTQAELASGPRDLWTHKNTCALYLRLWRRVVEYIFVCKEFSKTVRSLTLPKGRPKPFSRL
jgi:hypothetical protein